MNRKPTYEELKQKVLAMQDELANCKVIEKNLKISEEHYKQSVMNSPNPIFSVDQRGRIYTWNSSCERVFQYGQEMVGHSFKALFDKHDHYIDAKEMVAQVFDKKTLNNRELTYRRKDGILRFTVSRLYPVLDFNGEVKRCVFANTDITERKQVEEALREESDKAKRYLDIAAVIIIAINAAGEVTLINKKGCEILGYKEEEIVGKNWFENFVPERLRDNVKTVSHQLLDGEIEPVEYYENPVLTKKNQERIVAWRNAVLRDEMGNIVGHLSSGTDITERKQIEKSLGESEAKYRTLMEQIPAVTYTAALDEASTTLYISPQIHSMMGFTQTEYKKNPDIWREQLHPEDRERVLREVVRAHKTGGRFVSEYRMITKDGDLVWFCDEAVVVYDDTGKPICLQGVMSDISERKRAQKALQEAHDTLEQRVEERTAELAEAKERLEKLNTGLQVLIEHRQEEMKRLQENIMNNVNKLITPYLEKMDKKRIGSKNMAYLDVIASGLKELVSPFAGTLSSKEVVLSPTEIQVANLIRQGKTSKEIAFLMNVSANAITVHRYKIRKKLGLLNKKVNLMAYLQNLPK